MILAVCIGDGFADEEKIFSSLDFWAGRLSVDALVMVRRPTRATDGFPIVERWAKTRNCRLVGEEGTDAEWKKLGEALDREVGRRMLARHRPTHLLAFPGSGAGHELVHQARAAGVKCIEVV